MKLVYLFIHINLYTFITGDFSTLLCQEIQHHAETAKSSFHAPDSSRAKQHGGSDKLLSTPPFTLLFLSGNLFALLLKLIYSRMLLVLVRPIQNWAVVCLLISRNQLFTTWLGLISSAIIQK